MKKSFDYGENKRSFIEGSQPNSQYDTDNELDFHDSLKQIAQNCTAVESNWKMEMKIFSLNVKFCRQTIISTSYQSPNW